MSSNIDTKDDLIQEQILQAAKQLFSVYGLAKVTMGDVAKAIGKTRGSIYYYYKSKEEIAEAVISLEVRETHTLMEKAVNKATTAQEKIGALFITKLKMVRERHSFFDALEAGMDADAISNFNKTKNTLRDATVKWESGQFGQILNGGITAGELKNMEKEEMDEVVLILHSTLLGFKRRIRLGDATWNIESVVERFTQILLHGLKR